MFYACSYSASYSQILNCVCACACVLFFLFYCFYGHFVWNKLHDDDDEYHLAALWLRIITVLYHKSRDKSNKASGLSRGQVIKRTVATSSLTLTVQLETIFRLFAAHLWCCGFTRSSVYGELRPSLLSEVSRSRHFDESTIPLTVRLTNARPQWFVSKLESTHRLNPFTARTEKNIIRNQCMGNSQYCRQHYITYDGYKY